MLLYLFINKFNVFIEIAKLKSFREQTFKKRTNKGQFLYRRQRVKLVKSHRKMRGGEFSPKKGEQSYKNFKGGPEGPWEWFWVTSGVVLGNLGGGPS